jgi:stage V sporulation protein R
MAEPDLRRLPLAPEEDLLLFIRDHNPFLTEWERDLLSIVHAQAQ